MYDVVIIGAGIIGLTTGVKLLEKKPGLKLLVLDKEATPGAHQTGHNSGVIHSGIYYKPGSLKAKNCRNGVARLIRFCDRHGITYELCGKVIVATSEEEIPRLEELYQRGRANGVPDLQLIGNGRLRELEPHSTGLKALYSPHTGIIDFNSVTQVCANIIRDSGGEIILRSTVNRVLQSTAEAIVETNTGAYQTDIVVNCAGLYSDKIAQSGGDDPPLKIIPFRGEYYALKPESRYLVRNLIYPVPDPRFPFLGVHFTRGIDHQVEAGPNAVLAFAREGYKKGTVNFSELFEILTYPAFWSMAKKYGKIGLGEVYRSYFRPAFVKALQRLVPDITGRDLTAGGAGVRAQALHVNGKLIDDFMVTRSGCMINILNAPSPAATASLAIGDYISDLVLRREQASK